MPTLKRINKMIWPIVVLVLVGVAWLWFEGRRDKELFKPGSGCVNVHPKEASAFLQAHPETQVLDVRSAAEVSRGTLPGARHLSIGDPEFEHKVQNLDLSKPVLVYCAGGYRSRKAAAALKRLGFSNIQHLHRGYESWRLSGLPITQLSHPD